MRRRPSAGLVVTSANGSASPQAGLGDELLIISAVIIGGTALVGGRGNLIGTFLGVAFLAVLQNGMDLVGLQAYWQIFIEGVVLIIAVTDRRILPSPEAARGMNGAPSSSASERGEVVVRAVGLRKRYGTITAVDDVDLEIRAGEITAVVGDNGAGKSTLVKMLCGAVRPDAGEIYIGEERVVLRTPLAARERGVETVFQDLALAPNRDVVANLFLGRETVRQGVWRPLGILDRAGMRRQAREQLSSLQVNVPRLTGLPIAHLSGGQRQAVAVARAAFWAKRAMLMDEPTAALGIREATQVLKLARSVADRGLAVVVISHILPHVMELADRIIVMRHGRKVAEMSEDISSERLVRLIVGIDAEDIVSPEQRHHHPGRARSTARRTSGPGVSIPIPGVIDRLVRAALARERDARRRAGEHEAASPSRSSRRCLRARA